MTEDEEKYLVALATAKVVADLLQIFIEIEGDLPVGVGVTLRELDTYMSIKELSEELTDIIDTALEGV
jgi:hypothetical protein